MADSDEIRNTAALRATSLETRVDAPHARQSDIASSPEVPPASISNVEQMRTQAAQLAAHLKRQQADVDHREAELNARLADMENQLRGARLWLSERHVELAEQKADLVRREKQLAVQLPQTKVRSHPADDAKTTADKRELEERKAELDRRQQELDALGNRLAAQIDEAQHAADVGRRAADLQERLARFERAETLLNAGHSELERQAKLLTDERASFADHVEAERRALALEQQQAHTALDRARRDVERQADQLAARQESLERMRADIARAQEEALEMRLATEELWARLCGTMAPAALTQSLAEIRLKLADEGRLARADLAEQKTELQTLSMAVAEQHRNLAKSREEVQSWAANRQKELANQAGVLAAAEQRIEDERNQFRQQQAAWQNERFGMQQELRRLLKHEQPQPVSAEAARRTKTRVHA